jgi:predicted nucleic acid-binding protein
MIAADTSSLVAFFEGSSGRDVELIEDALHASALFMPPPVLTELLSDPSLSDEIRTLILEFPILAVLEGFWTRAGALRASVFAKNQKARLGDALIAQFALDHDLLLVTRDSDFKAFESVCPLKLAK